MRKVTGVRDLAAGEQADNCGLVAIRVAELPVVQSYDVFVADPDPADPACLGKKASSCRQTSSDERPQQRRIEIGFVDRRC
jgi:hypothetical protein